MRWFVLIGMGCLFLLLAACQSEEATPPGIIEVLPTRFLIPSDTPTPRPTRTALPTRIPRPTYVMPSATATLDVTMTPTPVELVELVVAVQPIPAGQAIPPDAVRVYVWPAIAAPHIAATDLAEVINQVSLVDIDCTQPILMGTLAQRTRGTGFTPLPDRCLPLLPLWSPITFVDIVIAVQSIPAGATIAPNMIAMRPWPEPFLPDDVLLTFADVIGRVARVDIYQEQPLQWKHVQP